MKAFGYSRDKYGRPTVREGDVRREAVTQVPDGPPMCPCQYSLYKDGVPMMCIVCQGPRQYYRFDHTDGDL